MICLTRTDVLLAHDGDADLQQRGVHPSLEMSRCAVVVLGHGDLRCVETHL